MRCVSLTCLISFCCVASSLSTLFADESAIREAIKSYVTAFNQKDLGSIEKLWTENAVYLDHQTGERTQGRAAIIKDITDVFDNTSVLNLAGSIENVGMVKDDVATVDGEVRLSLGGEPIVNKFSAIMLKQNDGWAIERMEEHAIVLPTTAADALQELQWLVGEWQDVSSPSPVRSDVRLAIGGSFLIRSFETTSEDGALLQSTQIIGWDPRAQHFRSWTFDADGSFGDGVWSKNDNQWLIKSTQTLVDGRAASGTYVLTMQNADAFTVQLIGRDIEGEPQPASAVVTVKRAPSTEASSSNALPTK